MGAHGPKFGGTPLFQIGSKTLTWTSQSPFQLRSTLFQPFGTTGTFKMPFGPIWANLGHFWGPLGQIWGHPAPPNWSKNFDLDLPKPVPTLFHTVPTIWDQQNLQIAILGIFGWFGPFLGRFGPFFGPGGPKFQKKCVGFVEQGSGHPQLLKNLHLEQNFEIALDPPLSHCVNPL